MQRFKKFLVRIFSMETKDLIKGSIKISLFCLFSLYFFNVICDYFNRQFYDHTRQILVNTHDMINRKSQKNALETDYNETQRSLDCLKNQCVNNTAFSTILYDAARKSQV